jgi:hypothetical protein
MQNFNPKKIITLVVCAWLILILIFALLSIKSTVEIESKPSGAEITINGIQEKTASTIKLKSGKYKLTVKLEGYEKEEIEIKVRKFKKEKITVNLKRITDTRDPGFIPITDEEYIERFDAVAEELEELIIKESNDLEKRLELISKDYPLINHLPYFGNDNELWFDYTLEGNKPKFFLRTKDPSKDLEKIRNWVLSLGITDPLYVEIISL